MTPLIDPRTGDVEDDVSSPKNRSLLAIAGTMLVEVSVSKVIISMVIMIIFPAVLLGFLPLLVTAWLSALPRDTAAIVGGAGTILVLVLVTLGAAWWGGLTFYRAAERNFWSLTSLVVQPGYALFREGLRHLAERFLLSPDTDSVRRARTRAIATAGAGIILCGIALWIVLMVWPATRWMGEIRDLIFPQRLIIPALANTVVVIGLFLAGASVVWAVADSTMDQPRDFVVFDKPAEDATTWRVAHLSDLHTVGGPYEFRLESGRAGPRGNDRVADVLARLTSIHRDQPLDLVIVTGDLTDAGRSTEWAAVLDVLTQHPDLAQRMLILPGNHDLNVVDRSNPARLETPYSVAKRLRQMRMLSAIDAVQGDRVQVMDRQSGKVSETLSAVLEPHRQAIAEFADKGGVRLSGRLARLWDDAFPMVLPPVGVNGLGVVLLNSNAETHFSFTNALGFVSTTQTKDLMRIAEQFPPARWIVALHHHLVEYPMPVKKFSARIGTALINGSSFVRQIQHFGGRVIVMHGHRHTDWMGTCGSARILSAPSPVMSPPEASCFYIHTLGSGTNGRLHLKRSERVDIEAPGMSLGG